MALYDYSDADAGHLDMQAGEQFTILDDKLEGGWSLVKNIKGDKGKVPTSYVKIGKLYNVIPNKILTLSIVFRERTNLKR